MNLGKREQQKQEVRSRITMAAIDLLTIDGYEKMMVDDVCERAQVARKTFYNYYSSKDDLLRQLCESLFYTEMANMVAMAVEQHDSLISRIEYVYHRIAETLADYEALERVLIQFTLQDIRFGEQSGNIDELQQLNNTFGYLVDEEIKRLTVQDKTIAFTRELIVEIIVGATLSMVFNWVNNKDYDFKQRVDEFIAFMNKSL